MSALESSGITSQFIDLGRTFHELSTSNIDNERMVDDYYSVGDSRSWDNLLNEKRLLIMSEAGSFMLMTVSESEFLLTSLAPEMR
ncbi:hypothetical protein [Salmonella enterica]|uniref:hypothetical protein n=1 Tax=Salmonella enterica TaxID=28901 RepID=UPI0009AAC1A5|nr:hypothetical protein [Salmonella enterica]HBC0155276.1 hypothetical protein [Salmonella enterica subsp. indica]HBC0166737.1 hypothetical protein [Salmonella enterica subsp. indica]